MSRVARREAVEEEVEEEEERRGRAEPARDTHDGDPADPHVRDRALPVDVRPPVREEDAREQHDRPGQHGYLDEDDELEERREGEHADERDPTGGAERDRRERRVRALAHGAQLVGSHPVERPGNDRARRIEDLRGDPEPDPADETERDEDGQRDGVCAEPR